jgi:hypothetical protein
LLLSFFSDTWSACGNHKTCKGWAVQSENSFADGQFFCEGCIDEGRMGDGGKQMKKKMKKKNRWS